MKLKQRLVVAFLIIMILPVIMASAIGALIIRYQTESLQRMYGVEAETTEVIANPLKPLNRASGRIFRKVNIDAGQNPDILLDPEYIQELNSELDAAYSFLVILQNGELYYTGKTDIYESIKGQIPLYVPDKADNVSEAAENGVYVSGSPSFLVKQQEHINSAGDIITVMIITDVQNVLPQLRDSATQAVVSLIIIIALTAATLVIWLYNSIIRPLNVLSSATKRVKDGDLDFTVSGDDGDELGQLCEDFESMRRHLKEQIDTRQGYEEATRELISNVSHDLKTPITAIKGYAEGILDGVADSPEKQEKYLRTIYAKACDMAILVDELSYYNKIDGQTVNYQFIKLPIDDYFRDCVDELSLDMEVKNISVSFSGGLPGVSVVADPEQLKRVVNNVISNAVKYMDKDEGHVEIRTSERGDFVQIEIEDSGKGIAPENLPYIFDRFYRADASRNTRIQGSGLGLAIAKKIIEDHSGRIWATSEPGVGTTIIFTLPLWTNSFKLIRDDVEDAEYEVKNRQGNGLKGLRLLARKDKEETKDGDKEKDSDN